MSRAGKCIRGVVLQLWGARPFRLYLARHSSGLRAADHPHRVLYLGHENLSAPHDGSGTPP